MRLHSRLLENPLKHVLGPWISGLAGFDHPIAVGVQFFQEFCGAAGTPTTVIAWRGAIRVPAPPLVWPAALESPAALVWAAALESPAPVISTPPIAAPAEPAATSLTESYLGNQENCNYNRDFEGR